jgi:2-oxoglutarate ferredoxin oxidoreductase subunit gamma
MNRLEILISGFGGQGVIKTGYILGKAASIYDTKQATLTQSFGPEARGSACSARVVIEEDQVLYPYLNIPDILVAMSQEGYRLFAPKVKEDGLILVDKDLVTPDPPKEKQRLYSIPATRIAEELGRRIVLNIVMFGFFTAITDLINFDSAKEAVTTSVPPRTIDLNSKAFKAGYDYGRKLLEQETSVHQ